MTNDELKHILSYDKHTGLFTWLVRPSTHVRIGDIAGRIDHEGYRIIGIGRRKFRAHRLAWFWMTGAWPKADIDHGNLDRSDNRWINLRDATRSQNKANAKPPATNTSGFKGASWHKIKQQWRATIKIDGKPRHIGFFPSVEEAHDAYCATAKAVFGEFSRSA